jgi:hypothetical protein
MTVLYCLESHLSNSLAVGLLKKGTPCKAIKQRCLVILIGLTSGNVQPNPGPDVQCLQPPLDFKSIIFNLNVRSLALEFGLYQQMLM